MINIVIISLSPNDPISINWTLKSIIAHLLLNPQTVICKFSIEKMNKTSI